MMRNAATILRWVVLATAVLGVVVSQAQTDLPNPSSNFELIPAGSLVWENNGRGIDTNASTGSHITEKKTVRRSGIGINGNVETPGIRIFGTNNKIDRNSIYDNALLNFPVLESASLSGMRLNVTGYARPGSLVEIFVASADTSGFGEGKTFGGSATKGSAADPDNTNRFRFENTLSGGVSDGTLLTATATLSGSTSEFSGVVTTNLKLPDIVLLKSVQCLSDPVNGGTNPKVIPGADMLYTVVVSNQGAGTVDADSLIVRDAVPVNSKLNLNDIDTPGSGPVLFEDGATTSDLTYTFTAMGSITDDLAFSADNGVTFDYTPVPDVEGFDDQITHFRVKPKGELAGSDGSNHPSFTLKFKTRVE